MGDSALPLERLLPACAVVVGAHEAEWDEELLPGEAALVARAVEKRRREFAAGRNCARRALARLGWPRVTIPAGPGREPLWPPGVVGSITHCAGYCAAVVARKSDLVSIGIDVERNEPLPEGVRELACTGEEHDAVGVAGADPGMLIFSAKESVYKAWYQITGSWLDYLDAAVEFDASHGTFAARLLADSAPDSLAGRFGGRFAVTPDYVFTAVAVRAGG